jgi:hypothetical protein
MNETTWKMPGRAVVITLVACLLFVGSSFPINAQNSEGRTFTNEAGQPIMAGDLDRVAGTTVRGDSPAWVEGHRWEPPRDRQHALQRILNRTRSSRSGREGPSERMRYFLLTLLTGAIFLRILLAWIVYRDLSRGSHDRSPLWLPVVLVGGLPGMVAYGIFRWGDRGVNRSNHRE